MKQKIHNKIFMLVFSLLLLLGGVNLFVVYSITENQSKEAAQLFYERFNKSLDADRKSLEIALTAIINRQDFQDTFIKQNRDELIVLTKGYFTELKNKFNITHFYFHNKDGVNFLRVHKPEQHGDQIKRYTFKGAVKENKMVAGLETGATAFALRVVAPVYQNDELIGYEEVGQEIDKILEEFKETTNADISFIVKDNIVNKEKFTKEQRYKNNIIFATTDNKYTKALLTTIDYENDRKTDTIFKPLVKSNDSWKFIFVNKLIDASGTPIGDIIITGSSEQMVTSLKTNGTILFIIFIAVAIALYLVTRNPIKNITKISSSIQNAASGDFVIEDLNIKTNDEIGQLNEAFKVMTSSLRGLITNITHSASSIANISKELSCASDTVNVALDSINQTTLELASSAQQEANSAQKAAKLSEHVVHVASLGGEAVDLTVKTINQIKVSAEGTSESINRLNSRSQQIGEIIGVITDIADQTNLLSLNAAIEAARAGENGRGFAVVADEVRKLAEQSSNAAKQISALIKEIQSETVKAVETMAQASKDIQEGVKISDETGVAFKRIVRDINEMAGSIHEIASASQQTNAGTQTVAAATTETTAAMQQLSASTISLSNMADHLQSLISKFKV